MATSQTDLMQQTAKFWDSLGMTMRSSLENEMVNLTYWLTRQLKQGMEMARGNPQLNALEHQVSDRLAFLQNLSSQLNHLNQSLDQHNQSIHNLEERISSLEDTVSRMALLDRKLADQQIESWSDLEDRVSILEQYHSVKVEPASVD